MPVIRIILLLVVLGGLTLMLAQNWSPVLPLVFLGMQTQELPVAVWILSSVAAGAFTSLLISGLFKLANYFVRPLPQRRNAQAPPPRSSTYGRKANERATSRSQPETDSNPSQDSDDWDSDSTNDDWDFKEDTNKTPNFSSQDPVRDSPNYEVNTDPKSGYRSGSVYSYSYREPSNSGVGRTESVYDADYRVITPPYRQPVPPSEDEDWGFDDDDKEGRDSPKR